MGISFNIEYLIPICIQRAGRYVEFHICYMWNPIHVTFPGSDNYLIYLLDANRATIWGVICLVANIVSYMCWFPVWVGLKYSSIPLSKKCCTSHYTAPIDHPGDSRMLRCIHWHEVAQTLSNICLRCCSPITNEGVIDVSKHCKIGYYLLWISKAAVDSTPQVVPSPFVDKLWWICRTWFYGLKNGFPASGGTSRPFQQLLLLCWRCSCSAKKPDSSDW